MEYGGYASVRSAADALSEAPLTQNSVDAPGENWRGFGSPAKAPSSVSASTTTSGRRDVMPGKARARATMRTGMSRPATSIAPGVAVSDPPTTMGMRSPEDPARRWAIAWIETSEKDGFQYAADASVALSTAS